jgi:hypothetical protein
MLPALAHLLDRAATIDPAAPPEARMVFAAVPAKMAVYLLADADPPDGSPLLLATVGDLRAALQRRIAGPIPEGPPPAAPPDPAAVETPAPDPTSVPLAVAPGRSKRVKYGEISTRVFYRVVTSPFEANWYYLQVARTVFPESYRQMISWRPAPFLAIDEAAAFPRFRRVEELTEPTPLYLGPISDRRAADKLIETLEDLFDLCRYHHILVQAPHGKACAYKEMGKCPAPCDGSISMDQYRTQIAAAVRLLTGGGGGEAPRTGSAGVPAGYDAWRSAWEERMKAAAAQLDFEQAARIKQVLTRGRVLEQESYRYLRPLAHATWLVLQPGPGKPWIASFFMHGGDIVAGTPAQRRDLPAACAAWFEQFEKLTAAPVRPPLDTRQVEHLALLAHHLQRGPDDAGLYLPPEAVGSPEQLLALCQEFLARRTPAKPLTEQTSEAPTDSPESSSHASKNLTSEPRP